MIMTEVIFYSWVGNDGGWKDHVITVMDEISMFIFYSVQIMMILSLAKLLPFRISWFPHMT